MYFDVRKTQEVGYGIRSAFLMAHIVPHDTELRVPFDQDLRRSNIAEYRVCTVECALYLMSSQREVLVSDPI